jgi:hypothetical protein
MSTSGMAKNLADRLEALSGYRHVFSPNDPQAHLNPVAFSHLRINVGGLPYHVLSRICAAGLDYTQRSNKFVHHVVLDRKELVAGGPAAVLATRDFMQSAWEGEPRVVGVGRPPPAAPAPAAICRTWQRVAGDAGWAGVLAESAAGPSSRVAALIFEPGTDTLALVAEALALLPPALRWQVTFSTYYTKLPPEVECQWRFVLAGSPEAKALARSPQTLTIDLSSPLGRAPDGPWAEAARTGEALALPSAEVMKPAAQAPLVPMAQPIDAADAGAELLDVDWASTGRRGVGMPRLRGEVIPRERTGITWWVALAGVVAVASTTLIGVSLIAIRFLNNPAPVELATAKTASGGDTTKKHPQIESPDGSPGANAAKGAAVARNGKTQDASSDDKMARKTATRQGADSVDAPRDEAGEETTTPSDEKKKLEETIRDFVAGKKSAPKTTPTIDAGKGPTPGENLHSPSSPIAGDGASMPKHVSASPLPENLLGKQDQLELHALPAVPDIDYAPNANKGEEPDTPVTQQSVAQLYGNESALKDWKFVLRPLMASDSLTSKFEVIMVSLSPSELKKPKLRVAQFTLSEPIEFRWLSPKTIQAKQDFEHLRNCILGVNSPQGFRGLILREPDLAPPFRIDLKKREGHVPIKVKWPPDADLFLDIKLPEAWLKQGYRRTNTEATSVVFQSVQSQYLPILAFRLEEKGASSVSLHWTCAIMDGKQDITRRIIKDLEKKSEMLHADIQKMINENERANAARIEAKRGEVRGLEAKLKRYDDLKQENVLFTVSTKVAGFSLSLTKAEPTNAEDSAASETKSF